jgi:hypothetical protein
VRGMKDMHRICSGRDHKMLGFWPDHIASIYHGTALDTSLLIDHRKDDFATEIAIFPLGG